MLRLLLSRTLGVVGSRFAPDHCAVDCWCPKIRMGTEYGGWWLNPEGLNSASIVYSFGIGEDISFDRELIKTCGVRVHGFDPTPRSLQWLNSQGLPDGFTIHEYGIAAHDGKLLLYPPSNSSHVSLSVVRRGNEEATPLELPVKRLVTVMEELGHDHIDLLKLDIEGAEYDVIPDVLNSNVTIHQLLVEFHHRFAEFGPKRTRLIVKMLKQHGFRLFNVSASGEELSFLKTSGEKARSDQ